MATHHAESGEVVDLRTWANDLPVEISKVIAKIDRLELARLVVPAGEQVQKDRYCRVAGPIVIHCVDGLIDVNTPEKNVRLTAGQLVYLDARTEHALAGVRDSVVLLTIVLQ